MPVPKGKRYGGKPKGYKAPSTLKKEAYEELVRARIAQDLDKLYEALILSGTGVMHMQARDKDGTWQEVTDPAIMSKCLNSGREFYRISARNPDVRALINLFDRLCGVAKQVVAVEGADGGPIHHEFGWRK